MMTSIRIGNATMGQGNSPRWNDNYSYMWHTFLGDEVIVVSVTPIVSNTNDVIRTTIYTGMGTLAPVDGGGGFKKAVISQQQNLSQPMTLPHMDSHLQGLDGIFHQDWKSQQ